MDRLLGRNQNVDITLSNLRQKFRTKEQIKQFFQAQSKYIYKYRFDISRL